jgi:hypothetical protein
MGLGIITVGSCLIAYSELARDIYERTQSGDCHLFIFLPQSHAFVML